MYRQYFQCRTMSATTDMGRSRPAKVMRERTIRARLLETRLCSGGRPLVKMVSRKGRLGHELTMYVGRDETLTNRSRESHQVPPLLFLALCACPLPAPVVRTTLLRRPLTLFHRHCGHTFWQPSCHLSRPMYHRQYLLQSPCGLPERRVERS